MKIGFDIDGVMANFVDQFILEYINPNLDANYKSDDMDDFEIHEAFPITKEQEAEWFNHARENEIFIRLQPYPGMIQLIKNLIKDGHEVYFITHRSKRAIEQTYKWFMLYKIPFGMGIYFTPKDRNPTKGEMVKYLGLDIFIEDCFDNLMHFDMRDSGAKLLVMNRPWNQKFVGMEDYTKMKRVYDALDIYKEVRNGNSV